MNNDPNGRVLDAMETLPDESKLIPICGGCSGQGTVFDADFAEISCDICKNAPLNDIEADDLKALVASYRSAIDERDRLQNLCETLRREAEIHAQEARTQTATVHEIYQICSGSSGELGNWNGAVPVRKLAEERDRYKEALIRIRDSRPVSTQENQTMKSNDEINRAIAEWMGLCWHDYHVVAACTRCGAGLDRAANPDYCSDNSPRRLLNDVIGKFHAETQWLEKWSDALMHIPLTDGVLRAEQLSRAIYACIKEQNES